MPKEVIVRVDQLGKAEGQPELLIFYNRKGQLVGDHPKITGTEPHHSELDPEITGVDMDMLDQQQEPQETQQYDLKDPQPVKVEEPNYPKVEPEMLAPMAPQAAEQQQHVDEPRHVHPEQHETEQTPNPIRWSTRTWNPVQKTPSDYVWSTTRRDNSPRDQRSPRY
jgi:hypothetical protein